jgi:aldose 1-epimerase
MQLGADWYTPVDDTLIPTGQVSPVKGTPIDFTKPKTIGQDIAAMGGYDHNLMLSTSDGLRLLKAAQVYEPVSGRVMEVWTTEPGMQFYSGNFFDGSIHGKNDAIYQRHAAFALECQHPPDAVNHASFPNTILRPGEIYRQVTEYRFGASQKSPW